MLAPAMFHFYWSAACIAKQTVLCSQRVCNVAIALRNQVIVDDPRYYKSGLLKLSQITQDEYG